MWGSSVLDNTKSSRGFTIAELNVTLFVGSLILLVIFAIFTNYFALITRNNVYVEMTADSQNLLRSMVEELRYGAGVRQNNTIYDANAPSGGWNTSNSNFVIIIAVPAKNNTGDYIIDTATSSPYKNEYVYYKNNGVLYKRILANPDAVGNNIKTTCPTGHTTSTCPEDIKLVENINTVTFSLYDQDDEPTNDALLARSVNIHAYLSQSVFGVTVGADNNMRITLRNTL
jgi:type II secretory pathway component PulJ